MNINYRFLSMLVMLHRIFLDLLQIPLPNIYLLIDK